MLRGDTIFDLHYGVPSIDPFFHSLITVVFVLRVISFIYEHEIVCFSRYYFANSLANIMQYSAQCIWVEINIFSTYIWKSLTPTPLKEGSYLLYYHRFQIHVALYWGYNSHDADPPINQHWLKVIYHSLYSINKFVTNKSELAQDGAQVFPYMGWLAIMWPSERVTW